MQLVRRSRYQIPDKPNSAWHRPRRWGRRPLASSVRRQWPFLQRWSFVRPRLSRDGSSALATRRPYLPLCITRMFCQFRG